MDSRFGKGKETKMAIKLTDEQRAALEQDLRSKLVVKAQTSVEEQIEFADNLVSEIQMNGGFDELDVAIVLDSMAILGYVLVRAEGENYASKAYLTAITK